MTPARVCRASVGECVESPAGVAGGSSRLRQAEVEHFDQPSGVSLDVGRFQVAVDDALFVRRLERVGDLPRDRQRLRERQAVRARAASASVALDELENERRTPSLSSNP